MNILPILEASVDNGRWRLSNGCDQRQYMGRHGQREMPGVAAVSCSSSSSQRSPRLRSAFSRAPTECDVSNRQHENNYAQENVDCLQPESS